MVEKITQGQRLEEVIKLSKKITDADGKAILIKSFIRHKVIREEVVLAYKSPVPSGVEVSYQTLKDDKYVMVKSNRQVNKGNYIVIKKDGSQETFTPEEFEKIYEPVKDKEAKD